MNITQKTTATLMDEFLTELLKNMYSGKNTLDRLAGLEKAIKIRVLDWLSLNEKDGVQIQDIDIVDLVMELLVLGGAVSSTFFHQEDLMRNTSPDGLDEYMKLVDSAQSAQKCNAARARTMRRVSDKLMEDSPTEKTYDQK